MCAAWLLPACLGETDGIAPPSDEFIFPIALASINDNSHLLVVNSNFDLQYNAGTLVAYDLSKLDTVAGQSLSYDGASGVFTLPRGTTFQNYCAAKQPGGELYCNLDPAAGILTRETIRLGASASELNITPAGDMAIIPVRGERAILRVDILGGANLIDCGESRYDEEFRCDEDHMITSNGSVSFPIEPYDVGTMDYVHDENGVEVVDTLGFATHRAGGEVSVFSVATQSAGGQRIPNNKLITVRNGVIKGASGLAVNPQRHEIYVVGQRDTMPHVAVLEVQTDLEGGGSYLNEPWFSQTSSIRISEELYDGTDARDIAVSPDGKTGFAITQSPPALIKMDLEKRQIQDMTTVCRGSSKVDTFLDELDPDDPLDDKLYAFVLCFLTGQVYVIDTDYMIPIIRKTGAGPQDITFDSQRKIAYIANFSESTISMIQAVSPFNLISVQEASGLEDARIVRIGVPKSPKGN